MLPTAKPLGMFIGWALDLITSLPETDEGEKYLIVAIDCYSKWVECGALTNCKSRTIAQWFYTNGMASAHLLGQIRGVNSRAYFPNCCSSMASRSGRRVPLGLGLTGKLSV